MIPHKETDRHRIRELQWYAKTNAVKELCDWAESDECNNRIKYSKLISIAERMQNLAREQWEI